MSEQADWARNTTAKELADWVRPLRRIVVLTHVKPDGDAVGSSLAITRALLLQDAQREVGLWYSGPTPPWLDSLLGDTPVRKVNLDHSGIITYPSDPDGIVITDTGSWAQLEEVRPFVQPRSATTAVIDHHLQGDGDCAARILLDPSAAAACQLCADVCCALLGVGSPHMLPPEVAEPLYVGMATDTGWYRHANVSAEAHALAAELIRAGAEHSRLYRMIEQQDRAARLRLMGRALSSMQLEAHNSVAVMSLTRDDFSAANADAGDSGGFSDLPLAIASVKVGVVLTEVVPEPAGGPVTKVSMRSKECRDPVDVNAIASGLGGGGHARAAGARVKATVSQAREMVLRALR